MNNTVATFTHDIYRVSIVQEEGAQHPWESHSQACQLICWDEDACFGGDDIEEKHRPIVGEITPERASNLYNALADSGRPFVFIGLHADKYGYIAMQSEAIGYSGAIVLTEELFKQFVDSNPMSDEQMYERMKEVAQQEFEMLKAYLGGQIYGYVVEIDNTHRRVFEPDLYGELKPFESGIDVLDSLWGFICIKDNYDEMYSEMVSSFLDEVPVEIKQQMLNIQHK